MLLSDLLRPDLIKPGLEAANKQEAIAELVDLLVQQHEVPMSQRNAVLETVLESEASLGTGMEEGLALPHGITDRVDDILCALGTAPQGIPFDSLDGKPATLVVLLLLPKRNHAVEVRAMAGISHLLEHHVLAKHIAALDDSNAIFELIEKEERH